MNAFKILSAAALAVILMAINAGSTMAAASAPQHPAAPTANNAAQVEGAIVVAQRRRGRGRRGRGRRRGRGAAAAGLIAGAIGAAIIANEVAKASEHGRSDYDDDAVERCADEYRSYRYSDGTFQPYGGGPRRLCPYL